MWWAVTGHRPEKLCGYGEQAESTLLAFALDTLMRHHHAIDGVYTGMALGWDQAIAEAAWALGIPYIAAVPCEGQDRMWPKASQAKYGKLMNHAYVVKMVSTGGYERDKLMIRNEWMVKHDTEGGKYPETERLLALWNGSSSGTAHCVMAAYRHIGAVNVVNVWPVFQHWRGR